MFSHNTGFRFRGGNFYSVTGDININPLAVTGDTPPHWGDREETEDTPNLQLDDPESQNDPIGGEYRRSDRQARRYMPYEASSRPRVQEIHITAPNVNHGIREGLDTLHRHAALEAMYNSAESFPQPRCHPETRIELLDDLSCRLNDPGVRVLWLYGPAGAGKSAIMQTLCQRLEKSEQLGGSYFFKRDHITRGHGRALFATLAYQLAIFDPTFKAAISKTVERNPSLVSTSIPSQLQQLIVQPCLTVPDDAPRILLIDGLDECEGIAVQQEILRSIHDIFCADALPLKILIASRPEPDIREMFDTWSFPGLYAVNVEQSLTDVEIYLRREFTRIHWEHRTTMSNVAAPWPSQDILGTLARKSSGYFVYAATVIKFVDDKQFRPTEQLDIILDPSSDSGDSPYSNLDTLYIQILRQVPTRLRPRLLAILSVVIAGWEFSPRDIEQSLGLKDGDVLLTLRKLHSLLSISGDLEPLKTRHASFGDFLLTNSRSSEFHITEQHRLDLARWAVKTLSSPQLPEKTHCTWSVVLFVRILLTLVFMQAGGRTLG
ncbi:hypothetical protein FB45DRAFT_228939 [Roridomyces roridus]|uniref:NACHT domain-containing protein n=1 Tax=Roridomyces roridus TaxID=1738132 RepID=A0AAD7BC53_9AGAR|nr:hypothetical protein FB45DRAFT_228939 [Roridomyces roridus]